MKLMKQLINSSINYCALRHRMIVERNHAFAFRKMEAQSTYSMSTISANGINEANKNNEGIPPVSVSATVSLYNSQSVSRGEEKEEERMAKLKNMKRKLNELEACLKLMCESGKPQPGKKENCEDLVDRFRSFISTQERRPDDQYQSHFGRALFSILDAFYQEGVQRKEKENALIGRIDSVLDCLENISHVKRQCFIGAVLMANNRSLTFFDYMKIRKADFTEAHLDHLCRIAHMAKKASVLEPIAEMPDLLPKRLISPKYLAQVYQQLALIYGQQGRVDKLEWLWRRLFETRHVRSSDRIHFKAAFHRIAHFYRRASQKLPIELAKELNRLDKTWSG